MKKKVFFVLAISLMLILPQTCQAAELINSTGSEATDLTKGEDITQGKKTEYYSDLESQKSNYDTDSLVSVFVTKGSMVKIRSPKTIVLGITNTNPTTLLSDASGTFKVGVLGDMGGTQKLSMSFPSTMSLFDGLKKIDAQISLNKKEWIWSDVNTETYTFETSSINVHGLSSGAYTGSFNIKYSLVNN